MNSIIIHLTLLLCCIFITLHGLRWSKSGLPVSYKTIHLTSATTDINIDVSFATPITIIRDVQYWNHSIIINCFISGYNNLSEIIYSFCKNNDPCVRFKDREQSLPFKEFNVEGNFETTFADKRGCRINVKVPNKYSDVSGQYFCTADNDKVTVQSNYVEIRDTFFWERKIFTKVESSYKSDIQNITTAALPTVLNCSDGNSIINSLLPVWARIQFLSVVRWSVCPVLKNFHQLSANDKMNPEKCLALTESKCDNQTNDKICPRDLNKMAGWQYHVTRNGDLIFTDLPLENSNTGDTYLLMCYTKNVEGDLQSISYFLNKKNDANIESGIAILGSQRTFSQKLEAISSPVQNMVLYAREGSSDRSLGPVAVYALYKASSDVSFQWRFNSLNLGTNNVMTITKYMVIFEKEITSENEGNYTLEIVDKTEKLTFTIMVRVVGAPILQNQKCMPVSLYVWANGNTVVSCVFKYRPNILKLMINSQEIHENNSLAVSRVQLKSNYPYLSELSFNVTRTNAKDDNSATLAYSLYNARKEPGQERYEDHSVTFIASNVFGTNLQSTSIYVLPPLSTVLKVVPNVDSCVQNCNISLTHTFRCDIPGEEYENKELSIDHFWTINNKRLDDASNDRSNIYFRYFKMNPKTKQLTLDPIISKDTLDTFMKETLRDATLECHFNLRSINSDDTTFEYYSSLDKDLGGSMKVNIKMEYASISTASHYWIVGVVLAIVIVIILVVLLIIYCKNKKDKTPVKVKYARAHGSVDESVKAEHA